MMEKGEFGLIDWIKGRFPAPDGVLGIGDDCAVLPQFEGRETLVSTDMLMEGVHFLLNDIDPFSLGWKSAAVNISDIAAMGGKPEGLFLAMSLPGSIEDGYVESLMEGFKALSGKFACPLLGGDTTASPDRLCISVTVLGSCASGKSLKRSSASPGDLVCVTGSLGDSAAGLRLILEHSSSSSFSASGSSPASLAPCHDESERKLIGRHYRPVPRVREGLILAETPGAGALMDISDGIASDLRHILRASGAGARINIQDLPLSEELKEVCSRRSWDPVELALCGGEDYELLFTCRPGAGIPFPHSVIGEIVADEGLEWAGTERDYMGFRHF